MTKEESVVLMGLHLMVVKTLSALESPNQDLMMSRKLFIVPPVVAT